MQAGIAPRAGAALCGVRLTLPLRVGAEHDVVVLEPAHCEWLVRTAAYAAVRDGLLGIPASVSARVLPGTLREWHGEVRCLDSCVVELRDDRGRQVTRVEFPREVFAPFVVARAVHLVAEAGLEGRQPLASSLHAIDAEDEPFPVSVPALPDVSIDDLGGESTAEGTPSSEWTATFIHPDVMEGFARLEEASREGGVETAGRIHARVGFDRRASAFVRVLERLVVTRDTVATASTIVSTSASWGAFLARMPQDGPTAPSHVHTHLHLAAAGEGDGTSEASLGVQEEPVISVSDRVTHLTTFTDPLAAGVILSLYPERRVVRLYGYTPRATLEEEPGYWVLPGRRRRKTT